MSSFLRRIWAMRVYICYKYEDDGVELIFSGFSLDLFIVSFYLGHRTQHPLI
jgi:hypothetical protein